MKAYTLDEAERWFTENSVGRLTCVKGGSERSCGSYPEAKTFFTESCTELESTESDDDNSIGIGLGFLAGAASGMFNDPSSDIAASTPDPTPDSSSFESGGGDSGGAGAGSDY